MKRKRFVKLVMSRGWQRWEANMYAKKMVEEKRPYGEEWAEAHTWLGLPGAQLRLFVYSIKARRSFFETASALASSISEEVPPNE